MTMKKTIGILTSGGDAPGMNAAIRAIVLSATKLDYNCIGFLHGYNGLIDGEYCVLQPDDVQDIIHKGGTLLKSARCPRMHQPIGITQAVNTLQKAKVDSLIVIGGDGSFNGLLSLSAQWQGQVIGIPGTIDNDVDGTDFTIGYSTAINTAINAIDKIRDTANAFDRVFIVEVMGRHSGHIAFSVGIATAAEKILSFETFNTNNQADIVNEIITEINLVKENKDRSYIIVLAENLWPGGLIALSDTLKSNGEIDSASCVLGHIQRGGAPVAKDRILATKLGSGAVQAIQEGKSNVMLGEQADSIVLISLSETIKHQKHVSNALLSVYDAI